MIKIEKLNKYYNKGKPNEIHVINDISLELPESGMVAIFGKSGCGKTTLLNVIGGLDSFGSGELTVDGINIGHNTDVIRNKYIGYIFQNYNLNKAETCFDNVADALKLCGMTNEDEIRIRVMSALRNVGLENYHARTPDTLSGGQQQRIAIARAIVKNPKIILADEPTGNLDEANTVMVMDLLKEISKDHLVLLVTHEANLVDYYCDKVIELCDGNVVSVKDNDDANGYTSKGKNDIYLGELNKSESNNENTEIEYYGEAPDTPISLTLVNNGGKLYIRINTPKVQIIDAASEIKLHNGVYEQKAAEEKKRRIDMSELPHIEGKHFGRLFGFKSAIKSGYTSNFKKGKKGKTILRGCMCLFAAVVVVMSAVFGTSFSDLIDAKHSYNHNVFYLYSEDASVSERLNAAIGDESTGIDYVRLDYGVPSGDIRLKFMTGYFESFSSSSYDESYATNAVLLDIKLTENMKTVAGKSDDLAFEEIVITTRVADALLENSSLGYIKEYDDLIGLITATVRVGDKNLRIAGVVSSNESAVYLSENAMAQYVMNSSQVSVKVGADNGFNVAEGETVFFTRNVTSDEIKIPSAGDTVKIHGRELKVTKTVKYESSYDEWLNNNGIEIDNQDISESDFEYYDRYFTYFDTYMQEKYFFDSTNDIDVWLYVKKGITEVKYAQADKRYYVACKYKEEHGAYPDEEELASIFELYREPFDVVNDAHNQYDQEYCNSNETQYLNSAFYVSQSDYIAMSKQNGETDAAALFGSNTSYSYGSGIIGEGGYVIGGSGNIVYENTVSTVSSSNATYTVIHSNDPARTEEYLKNNFSNVEVPQDHLPIMLTPNEIFDTNVAENYADILTSIIAMLIILAIMSLCMYFIMRSSLMNRIKEVGIYRAIGVSKKNLVFRFFIESVLLVTLTVFLGYALTSTFLFAALEISPMIKSVLYYPYWLAGCVFIILYSICLFFGTLPILSLLRKTPSEILSKYDI